MSLLGFTFVATHLALSHPPVRGPLVRRMGDGPFRLFYSAVSLASFIPLVYLFVAHRHTGAVVFRIDWSGIVHVTELLVVLGFGLLLGSFAHLPASSFLHRGAAGDAAGMTAITRHPVSMGVSLWGVGHMLVNPWASDLLFYGSFVAVGILGSLHQDRRKAVEVEGYSALIATTHFLPWPSPKNLSKVGVRAWAGFTAGVGLAVILRLYHADLFG
jgi:uncharacterized membrane protein